MVISANLEAQASAGDCCAPSASSAGEETASPCPATHCLTSLTNARSRTEPNAAGRLGLPDSGDGRDREAQCCNAMCHIASYLLSWVPNSIQPPFFFLIFSAGPNEGPVCRLCPDETKLLPPFQNYVFLSAKSVMGAVRLHTVHGLSAAPPISLLASCLHYGTWVGLPSGSPAKKPGACSFFHLGCPPESLCSSLFHVHEHVQECTRR